MTMGEPGKASDSAVSGAANKRSEGRDEQGRNLPRRTPVPLWNNYITMFGIFLCIVSMLGILTFTLLNVVASVTNPYVDIVGYLVIPGTLVLGLLIIPTGVFIKSWRVRRRQPEEHLSFRFPRVDFNDPEQRKAAKVVVGGTFILLPLVGVSGYHGYHYTDSAEFCAKACHEVMEPEATTYEHSAHARVRCAECHIGSGASWFVKSKLSGTRQVLAVMRDSFPRPIPPAITELRPARETCEQCHWPKKFFGAQLVEITRFAADEKNTRREINMLLKTGGGDETTGRAQGIHLHMALAGRIEYVATDNRLQQIPWVKFTDDAGSELIYRSDERPSSDPPPKGQLRRLDCMDCHNRPAHEFRSPQEAVDLYMEIGAQKIDPTLPYIKREATRVLSEPYTDVETAVEQIKSKLGSFYRENYPEIWSQRWPDVNRAIDAVRELYRLYFFPDMRVDWRTYSDNIGHKYYPGCFRCHGGRHVNQFGHRLSHDCDQCHSFLNPLASDQGGTSLSYGKFRHPMELKGPHAALRCDQCHDGGASPLPTCASCHSTQSAFRGGALPGFGSSALPAEPMAKDVGCEDCHDLSAPASAETINAACMSCHEDEEERFKGMLSGWKQEATRLLAQADQHARTDNDRQVLEALRKAGPLHNLAATRIVIASLLSEPATPPATEESP